MEATTLKKYGRLTVLGRSTQPSNPIKVTCRCDCGVVKDVNERNLVRGLTESCGCLQKERTAAASRKHGASAKMTSEYRIWIEMRQRCTNPKCNRYYSHGARGIKVCERWNDYSTFLADMGPRPPKHSIDRRDNDGDYTPENCRWATAKVQGRNRRTTIRITLNGETRPLIEWCERLGFGTELDYQRIRKRLKSGWTPEEALSR